jgi:hypothetical protein
MNEHYITAMTSTGYAIMIACRCGWAKFGGTQQECRDAWRYHTAP